MTSFDIMTCLEGRQIFITAFEAGEVGDNHLMLIRSSSTWEGKGKGRTRWETGTVREMPEDLHNSSPFSCLSEY